mgnify:CR=1 FL=1
MLAFGAGDPGSNPGGTTFCETIDLSLVDEDKYRNGIIRLIIDYITHIIIDLNPQL